MPDQLKQIALSTKGFMPEDEGDALFAAAIEAARVFPAADFVEIGSYCGRSTVWLGVAARLSGVKVHAVDHHGGSEENQPGWEWHDESLVNPATGRLDTLPHFLATLDRAGLNDVVNPVVAESRTAASSWTTPISLLFIDGGHGREVARTDWTSWSPLLRSGATLAIHDVFVDERDGGQAPYEEIYLPAIAAGFTEISRTGSLRVLRKP
jgi:predicted O-methyltransferase YrrM